MIQIDQELFNDLCDFLDSSWKVSNIDFQNAQSLKSRLKDCQIQQINKEEEPQVKVLNEQITLLEEINSCIDRLINKEANIKNKLNTFESGEKQNEDD